MFLNLNSKSSSLSTPECHFVSTSLNVGSWNPRESLTFSKFPTLSFRYQASVVLLSFLYQDHNCFLTCPQTPFTFSL
ncbi:hypothetical protein L2E82_08605 [Cichorium intybus]|uniref:Uncharacterized protein n=1 Tax=Cichorium intybus TaxID=13427 RepID=A0ACB9G7P2_CICIN|nr:hypothetical protein L2E82_08605 [Cichorium intybus]